MDEKRRKFNAYIDDLSGDASALNVEVDEDDWVDAEAAKVKERDEGENALKDAKLERESQ